MALPGAGFLHAEAARIIAERLAATNRRFADPVVLFDGPCTGEAEAAIGAACPAIAERMTRIRWPDFSDEAGCEIIDLVPESIDLAISVFDLWRISDLSAILLQLNHALKPDGLLMACLPAAGSLDELRHALLETEAELTGGAASRVDVFPGPADLGNLMQQCGFRLVVSDVEERKISYRELSGLVRDLRATGSASLNSGQVPRLPRSVMKRLEDKLVQRHGISDGRFAMSFNMVFFNGWKHDASQQQPLTPGSAGNRLKDFL